MQHVPLFLLHRFMKKFGTTSFLRTLRTQSAVIDEKKRRMKILLNFPVSCKYMGEKNAKKTCLSSNPGDSEQFHRESIRRHLFLLVDNSWVPAMACLRAGLLVFCLLFRPTVSEEASIYYTVHRDMRYWNVSRESHERCLGLCSIRCFISEPPCRAFNYRGSDGSCQLVTNAKSDLLPGNGYEAFSHSVASSFFAFCNYKSIVNSQMYVGFRAVPHGVPEDRGSDCDLRKRLGWKLPRAPGSVGRLHMRELPGILGRRR